MRSKYFYTLFLYTVSNIHQTHICFTKSLCATDGQVFSVILDCDDPKQLLIAPRWSVAASNKASQLPKDATR